MFRLGKKQMSKSFIHNADIVMMFHLIENVQQNKVTNALLKAHI